MAGLPAPSSLARTALLAAGGAMLLQLLSSRSPYLAGLVLGAPLAAFLLVYFAVAAAEERCALGAAGEALRAYLLYTAAALFFGAAWVAGLQRLPASLQRTPATALCASGGVALLIWCGFLGGAAVLGS